MLLLLPVTCGAQVVWFGKEVSSAQGPGGGVWNDWSPRRCSSFLKLKGSFLVFYLLKKKCAGSTLLIRIVETEQHFSFSLKYNMVLFIQKNVAYLGLLLF